jgi:CRP-like cAMP-binding protein
MNLFDLMPERTKDRLQHREYEKGDTILFAGAENTFVYFLRSGKAAAYIPTEEGRFAQIYLYEAGSVFGELEQFCEGEQSVEIAAIAPCTVERLHRNDFFDWLQSDFESTKFFIRQISYKLLQNGKSIEEISVRSVRERLLRCIAAHVRRGDLENVSKEQIVKEVKAPRRSINRAIAACAEQNLLRYEGRRFTVPDETALLKFLKD